VERSEFEFFTGRRPADVGPMDASDMTAVADDGSCSRDEIVDQGEDDLRGGVLRRASQDRRWRGLPEHRPRVLFVLIIVTALVGAAAGFAAARFESPNQVAARAIPPPPSLVTARVRFGVLPTREQLRAEVSIGHEVKVGPPSELGASRPVVTSVNVRPGQRVTAGRMLVTVAQRPVFVFAGAIPAYRTITPGARGPDISELQAGLIRAGYGIGVDATGVYGPGTSAAVEALYRASGATPVTHVAQVAPRARQVTAARSALGTAKAALAADRRASASQSVITADEAAVGAARDKLAMAQTALATAERLAEATIPLGEVAFVPHLPATVASISRLGSTANQSVATLLSGRPTVTAAVDIVQARPLRVGMNATASSDTSGLQFPVRLASLHEPEAVFVPVGSPPSGAGGQNVLVTIITSRVKALIVPVAAVTTSASGETFITVVRRARVTAKIPVRLGPVNDGQQAVWPRHAGSLRSGESVALGIGAAISGGF
jgi:HlyD family secretion protein